MACLNTHHDIQWQSSKGDEAMEEGMPLKISLDQSSMGVTAARMTMDIQLSHQKTAGLGRQQLRHGNRMCNCRQKRL